ncbi:MAG TPA: hypothetical protein DCY75_01615, partial [Clostridiales bacterium]|nr:hypothetical protein [Clostridiales bacterium]
HTQMRIMPNGCTFVTGLNLTGGDYSNDYSVNIGGQSLSAKPFGVSFEASLTSDASCKLYGGTISFVYGSINSTKRIAAAYVDNNVNIYQIVLNNTGNWADFSVYILGGRVENLKFGFNGSIYRVAGTFTAYIKGGVVANIMDYGNSAYTLAGYTHLQECTRNLVFDGFRGTTTYYHLDIGNTAENVKASNGLDNLSFINGSSVNFTNHAVHMRSKIGSYVYFDSTSSLQEGSKGIAGSFVAN